MTTRKEARHLDRVASLGCALCKHVGFPGTPAEVHHIRSGDAAGAAQRASHFLGIPLCPRHHRGPTGIHGDRTDFKNARVTELSLLAAVLEELFP